MTPTDPTRPALSLVFPVFDEEANLGPLLEHAVRIAARIGGEGAVHGATGLGVEIVVVDDGSRDGSAAVVERFARRHPGVRLIRHAGNRGYGAALRAGLLAARGELVFFSDADLQFDLDELVALLAHARDADIVAGYRAPRRDPFGRRVLAWGWNRLVGALFDLDVRDIDCAFKVFRRRVLETVPLASIGAFINTELLVRARSAGFRVQQVPVTHRRRPSGRQSGARPRVVWRALAELAGLYRELARPQLELPADVPSVGEAD